MPNAPTWGYGGASYLGPTISAKRGVPIEINAQNDLGPHPLAFAIDPTLHGAMSEDATSPRASLHLHGGNTEPGSDGHPEDTFLPGDGKTYHYVNDQEATNLWYHDHALGITRLNVMAGLAGFYLLRDDWDTGTSDNPIGLPAGQYEVPLVIQDRMFTEDGAMDYPAGPLKIWSPEFFGDVAVVNGKAFPNLDVDRGLYRFRVINGSNARVYNFYLSNNRPFFQIGGDGGLLNAPVSLTRLILAPGERADLLIDFSNEASGTKVILKNTAPAPFPDGPRSERKGGLPLKEIMQFTVGSALGFTPLIPASLRATPIIPLPAPVKVRNLSLVEIMDMEADEPLMALLNNLPWDTNEIEQPKVDTVERWNIINTTGDTHPIHLHLVQFQVLSRQKFRVEDYLETHYEDLGHDAYGSHPVPSADPFLIGRSRKPDANEGGWKDTVRANPGEVLSIMVPFGGKAAPGVPFGQSFVGDYVWHCHILEHEDNEMMLPYQVVA
ncbi:MAG: multicopper oxidase domain-containing protein [bacterium]|nr:multicopper oxidase domain-containing protein [bacterium]